MSQHEYLINQSQFEPRIRLNFTHPVKEFLWNKKEFKPKFERKFNNFTIHKNEDNKNKNDEFYKTIFFKLNQFD
jgi:hypothetical protein